MSKAVSGWSGALGSALNGLRSVLARSVKQRLKAVAGLPPSRLHPDWAILRHAGPVREPHVVLDVGARNGWFFHCWKDWCPAAEIHAFEPDPEAAERLSRKYAKDPRVTVVAAGVGDEAGALPFNVLEGSRVSSSFLAPRRTEWERLDFQTGNVSTLEIPVLRLDSYVLDRGLEHIHLLKVDVQGYELKVLAGASGILDCVDFVFVEAGITPLYDGAPRFTDVASMLLDSRFDLVTLRAWHQGDGALVETDLLFRSVRLRGGSRSERVYMELA